ncbi:dihydrofolate reductase family protein [Flavobacterium olei]|uniref:dihydrofolate reductase family protein n=1 Tax=Flavobacterium olei TaxID=1886782 RepID=UPI00321BB43D
MRKVILYIATSLDGYIAQPNDDLSFLSIVEQEGQDYGYADFIKTVDAVIVGRKTYDKVISMGFDFPHADKDAYIITRTSRPNIGNIKFYTGGLKALVEELKLKNGKNIFCDGGAEIVNELLKSDLIDEFIISIIPILAGNGTKLFTDGRPEQKIEFVSVKSFEKGLTQLHYKRAVQ